MPFPINKPKEVKGAMQSMARKVEDMLSGFCVPLHRLPIQDENEGGKKNGQYTPVQEQRDRYNKHYLQAECY